MTKAEFITKLKRPRYYVSITLGVLIVGFMTYGSYAAKNKPVEYETTTVSKGNLTQTIEAIGKLESKDGVELRFETPGTLTTISVKEGQQVKTGQVLASLRLSELNASLNQASANLRQKMAGATEQDRNYYKAALESANASWQQAQTSALADIANAKSAVATAEANLKLAEGGNNSQIVTSAYAEGVATLQITLAKLEDALTKAKESVDYFMVIPVTDSAKKQDTDATYADALVSVNSAKTKVSVLTSASTKSDIDDGFSLTEPALGKTITTLSKVASLLNDIPRSSSSASQSTIDSQKTTIAASRTTITAQYSTFLTQKQALANAKNSFTTYQIAYNKALNDLQNIETTAAANIKIKEAAYMQAKANYEGKVLPTREVDLAPYRAAVAIAAANRERAILRAPVDGVVGKIGKKKGELVTSADAVVQIVSPHFEIKVDVPETDIAKIVNSTRRDATFTLDAFGEENKFSGAIITVNQDSTEIQDVVYYQVTIAVNDEKLDKSLQSGMTANVEIITDTRENVLFVPQRVLRTRENGEKFIRVLNEDKTEREATVTVGLRADDGKVEILEGLNEGETVIISAKK